MSHLADLESYSDVGGLWQAIMRVSANIVNIR